MYSAPADASSARRAASSPVTTHTKICTPSRSARASGVCAPSVTRRLIEEFVRSGPARTEPPDGLSELTARELEVLQAIARGLSNAEIAQELFVSETTVKTHVAHVFRKLGVRDRVQAVVFAYESGLVQPSAAQ